MKTALSICSRRSHGAGPAVGVAEALLKLLDDGVFRKPMRNTFHSKRYRLVTRALKRLDALDLTQSVQAQELAHSLGVTGRTLEHAFNDFIGVTPYRYIILKRLHQVRRILLHSEPSRGLVTKVAGQAGFDNLSRMSAMYRELYGETPVQTLGVQKV